MRGVIDVNVCCRRYHREIIIGKKVVFEGQLNCKRWGLGSVTRALTAVGGASQGFRPFFGAFERKFGGRFDPFEF